jgi:predicted transcriptional regulator
MDDAPKKAPAGWLEALAESEADLAAGRTVPLEKVLHDLDESIRRLETKQKHSRKRRRAA